jgi:hypothetical protein
MVMVVDVNPVKPGAGPIDAPSDNAIYGASPRADERACAIPERDLSYAPIIRSASCSVIERKGGSLGNDYCG